jgi:hypothetical protein
MLLYSFRRALLQLLAQWAGSELSDVFNHFFDNASEFSAFGSRDPFKSESSRVDSNLRQNSFKKCYSFLARMVSSDVMTIANVTASDEDAVYSLPERFQHMKRVYSSAAHCADYSNVRWIRDAAYTSQICASVAAPIA